jgi:glycosyltransferase involved in cell wall biosynthesis
VELVYHGVDSFRFPAPPPRAASNGPAVILSVCRLVEKKGVDTLLEALALLPVGLNWKLVQVGSGPLRKKLERLADSLRISGKIEWRGSLTQDQLLIEYRKADLFALASRIARDGDRDGLPNVIAEAQSQALACVATRVSAIPELVRDGATGLLVGENDPEALARALGELIVDPARRRSLGMAGQARIREQFMLENNLDRLAAKFGLSRNANRILRTA